MNVNGMGSSTFPLNESIGHQSIGRVSAGRQSTHADSAGTSALFLKLLVAQIRHQDPLSPQNPGEFVTQLSQFNQIETMQNMVAQGKRKTSLLEQSFTMAMASQVGNQIRVKRDAVQLLGTPVQAVFTLPDASDVNVVLTAPNGRQHIVKTGLMLAGEHAVTLSAKSAGLPPGVYAVSVRRGSDAATDGGIPVEIEGTLTHVQMGADREPVLHVSGVGAIRKDAVSGFMGRGPAPLAPVGTISQLRK